MVALPDAWLPRLRGSLLPAPDHATATFGPSNNDATWRAAAAGILDAGPIRAAVLVPIVLRGADSALLLTRRHSGLRRHAGQISFPGGRVDPGREDVVAAALRETEEETGVARQFVEPIGFLTDHLVQTGFQITPVVALLQPGFRLQAHAAEVEEIFELPLALALTAGSYQPSEREIRGRRFVGVDLHYGAHRIWGATASMLRSLCERFERAGP